MDCWIAITKAYDIKFIRDFMILQRNQLQEQIDRLDKEVKKWESYLEKDREENENVINNINISF